MQEKQVPDGHVIPIDLVVDVTNMNSDLVMDILQRKSEKPQLRAMTSEEIAVLPGFGEKVQTLQQRFEGEIDLQNPSALKQIFVAVDEIQLMILRPIIRDVFNNPASQVYGRGVAIDWQIWRQIQELLKRNFDNLIANNVRTRNALQHSRQLNDEVLDMIGARLANSVLERFGRLFDEHTANTRNMAELLQQIEAMPDQIQLIGHMTRDELADKTAFLMGIQAQSQQILNEAKAIKDENIKAQKQLDLGNEALDTRRHQLENLFQEIANEREENERYRQETDRHIIRLNSDITKLNEERETVLQPQVAHKNQILAKLAELDAAQRSGEVRTFTLPKFRQFMAFSELTEDVCRQIFKAYRATEDPKAILAAMETKVAVSTIQLALDIATMIQANLQVLPEEIVTQLKLEDYPEMVELVRVIYPEFLQSEESSDTADAPVEGDEPEAEPSDSEEGEVEAGSDEDKDTQPEEAGTEQS